MIRAKRALAAFVVILLIVLVSSSGCLQTFTWKHPQYSKIIVDTQGRAHVFWIAFSRHYNRYDRYAMISQGEILLYQEGNWNGDIALIDGQDNMHLVGRWGSDTIGYIKLNSSGEVLISKRIVSNNTHIEKGYIQDKIIDVAIGDMLHICSVESIYDVRREGIAVWHTILDLNGDTLREYNLTSYMRDCVQNDLIRIHIDIDSDSNLHLLWDNDAHEYNMEEKNISKIRYLKQVGNGTVEINITVSTSTSTFLRSGDILTNKEGETYIFWQEFNKAPAIYDPIHTYITKFDSNGMEIFTKEIPTLKVTDVKIDPNEKIYVVGTTGEAGEFPDNDNGVYIKLDTHGNVLLGPTQFTDKVYGQSAKLAVDSNGNVHIVWHGMERIWRTRPFSTEEYSERYYTVYYSKLDSSGNIVIDELILDADEKPTTSFLLIIIGIIIIATTVIVISLVSAKILLKRRKGKEASKTPLLKEKHPPPPW